MSKVKDSISEALRSQIHKLADGPLEYTADYHCDNCNGKSVKRFKRGVTAPKRTVCGRCGCNNAIKCWG